jgi:hypothetical protein
MLYTKAARARIKSRRDSLPKDGKSSLFAGARLPFCTKRIMDLRRVYTLFAGFFQTGPVPHLRLLISLLPLMDDEELLEMPDISSSEMKRLHYQGGGCL